MGFTLEKQIVQHTPLVHFHAQQRGATLRGTEFKAKLDKFLIKKLGEERCREWYFGDPDQQGLDYRVTVTNEAGNVRFMNIDNGGDEKNKDQYPLFFANLGAADEDKKAFSWTENPARLQFFSFFSDLLSSVEAHLPEFLATTNFGTRQGKGFGSFYLAENDLTPEQWTDWGGLAYFDITINNASLNVYTRISLEEKKWHYLFEQIDLFYRSLRGGINGIKLNHRGFDREFYFKSLLFKYFKDVEKQQWDKKSIKERYFPIAKKDRFGNQLENLASQKAKHPGSDILEYSSTTTGNSNRLLVRDLLGLSSEESWKGYFENNKDKVTKDHEKRNDGPDKIGRFPSPLFIKPIKTGDMRYRVYLKANPINPDFLGETFQVNAGGEKGLRLDTPDAFDLTAFLRFAFHVNLRNHVNPAMHGKAAFTALESIYSQLLIQVPPLP